jgi:hypothetical protein
VLHVVRFHSRRSPASAALTFFPAATSIGRSLERAIGAYGFPQDHPGMRDCRRDDCWIGLLGKRLVKKVAVAPQSSSAAFMGG